MKYVKINYTVYSPEYVPGQGECWDFATVRGARAKARKFGVGAVVVRNFNQVDRPGKPGDWWQSSYCWVWNGFEFLKAYPVIDTKWIVPDHHWVRLSSLIRRRVAQH